jgi:hypothetical protein
VAHLIHPVQALDAVGQQQHRRRRVEQVGHERLGGPGVEAFGGLVEHEDPRAGQAEPRGREPAPFPARHRVGADDGVQPLAQTLQPPAQPDLPDPDAPVTAMRAPAGRSRSTSRSAVAEPQAAETRRGASTYDRP